MKIALIIGSLRLGGAQRAAVTLCNHWVSDHEVALVTLDDGRFHDFEILSLVERVDLRLPS